MVEEGGINLVGGFDEGRELFADIFFIGEFSVGDDVDVGVILEDSEEEIEVDRMVLVLPQGRHEICIGEVGHWFGALVDDSAGLPMPSVVSGDSLAVISNKEVNLKDAVTELIIEQKGLVGVSVRVTKDTAKGVGDIGIVFSPGIIKVVGRFGTRNLDCAGRRLWGGILAA